MSDLDLTLAMAYYEHVADLTSGRALPRARVGVPLADVDWFQAGVNQAGRIEHAELRLPPSIRLTAVPARSLDDMLLDGSIARHASGPAGPGSRVPLLWTDDALARTRVAFGGEPWPYGVDANRTTLDAFTRWAYEQGVTGRRVDVDELFRPSVRFTYRI